ncbi:discoidin domain-containing protein [Pectobacterium aroidearum]|uniref:discoidin domain-containing protein n=1 Tax=Pectobacterium aroidearum TaxID=1201031 RepID=UPI002113E682|nr:discoidin domain-containing protein [Pectobacterium aroidearum]UUE35279.1 discoidin domain-containing protein [Pectobacterium aroidearum]UUE39656.1 discoidin domain-containing protein [Pectobacterium aroidearum]
MKDINIEINVCDSTGKATCTVHPPVCCHSDNGSGQEPGVSGVASVFGRTGVVTAQSGDYTADQITETATRKFATLDEKAVWNAKQDELISGTTIRTLFGQSLLGSGDLSLTPAQMGVATVGHTHTTAEITDYTQKTKQLIHSSLEAGAGVTLSYNPANEKTIISAAGGGSGSGGSGYIVADRQGATAGQNHAFSIRPQNTFNLAAYALKEVAGAANQTYVVDDFNASSEPNYNATNDVIFDGIASLYTGSNYQLTPDGEFYSAEIKADGELISILQKTSTTPVTAESIIPVMTANNAPAGYEAIASSNSRDPQAGSAIYKAFNRSQVGGTDSWTSDGAPSVSSPQWVGVKLPASVLAKGYSVVTRNQSGYSNSPRTWTFQGSHDGVTWTVLHSITNDTQNIPGQKRTYVINNDISYQYYRIHITLANYGVLSSFVGVDELEIYESLDKFVINYGGKNYGVNNGLLEEIVGELTAEKISSQGIGGVNNLPSLFTSPVKVISNSEMNIETKYTPYSQILTQSVLTSLASYSQINAATLTATQTGNGKVRVAVTRDLVNWHVLRNGVWVDIGALSADTAGATALIADGMTPTELGAITAAQWTQLFSSNNGVPDSLAFAFALDITDPAADVATIDRLVLNVNDASNWKVQSPAEVEIRWHTDSVTFRTVTAGNYKLAYQVP